MFYVRVGSHVPHRLLVKLLEESRRGGTVTLVNAPLDGFYYVTMDNRHSLQALRTALGQRAEIEAVDELPENLSAVSCKSTSISDKGKIIA